MKTKTLKNLAIIALSIFGFFATPQPAHAGYPVMDIGNILQNTSTAISSAGHWVTGVAHKVEDGIAWAADYIEQKLHSGLLGYIFTINQIMQGIQDDINQAAGTVSAIIGLPKTIMEDIMGVIGSVKSTIMEAAGVVGIWDDIQGVVESVSNIESLIPDINGSDLLDFGDFKNAQGLNCSLRGVRTRVAVEHLKQIDDERQTVETIIGTFENSTNAAAIAKGHAQLAAAQYKEAARSAEMASIDAQANAAESWSREAVARSRAAAQTASSYSVLVDDSEE